MQTSRSTSVQVEEDGENDRPSKRPRRDPADQNKTSIREIGLMRTSDEDNYPSFLGSASGIHFIRSVYTAAADKDSREAQQNQTPSSNLVPGEDDRLHGGTSGSFDMTLWYTSEVSNRTGQDQFTYEDMLLWTKSYFNNWHAAYPFLYAPSVLESFERLTCGLGLSDNDDENVMKLAILRSVMSISLADRRQSSNLGVPVPSHLVFRSFKHATDSINLTLSMRTSILSLQAVVAVQLFLISMLRHNAASRLGGLVTRMVFHLGLHRCPARYSSFSKDEIELRQRLFWSVYCIDRHVCQSLGLPLTLRDDDIDVCFLDHERHTRNHDRMPDLDSRLQLLNLLSKQAEIKGLIIELLHKSIPHRLPDGKRSTNIDAKLTRWSNEVDAHLDYENETSNLLSDFHELLLGILKNECVIALNRPLLAASERDSYYSSAMQTCVGASRFIIINMHRFLKNSMQKANESVDGKIMTPLLWPSFTWAIWMSAFILIFAAIEDELPADVALKLTDRSMEVLRHLSVRGSVWPSACEVAIRELRTKLVRPLSVASRAEKGSNKSTASFATQAHTSPKEMDETPEGSSNATNMSHMLPQHRECSVRDNNNVDAQERPHQTPMQPATIRPIPPEPNNPSLVHGFNDPDGWHTANLSQMSGADTSHFGFGSYRSAEEATTWPNSSALSAFENVDLFQGFEIPFWMGDDQYNSLMNN